MQIGPIEINTPLFLAPMAGVTDLPTRLLARDLGAGMAYTEMVSANALVMENKKTETLFATVKEDRPLGVQIFGSDPKMLVNAALILQERGFSLIDINMGCPVRKIVRSNSGASLLRDLPLIEKILKLLVKELDIPVTVKIRSGWGKSQTVDGLAFRETCLEVAAIAEQCGVAAITIHGRTALQSYSGKADWKVIERVKRNVSIPVIGNGDIVSPYDALKMFDETGCDAVMIGRGSIGNPWIFKHSLELLRMKSVTETSLNEKKEILLRHLNGLVDFYGNRTGLRKMRTHISRYVKGQRGAVKYRNTINTIESVEEFKRITVAFFEGLMECDGVL